MKMMLEVVWFDDFEKVIDVGEARWEKRVKNK